VILLIALLGLASLVFLALLFLFSVITGWRALAQAFPLRSAVHAEHYRAGGVVLGVWGWAAPPLWVGIDEVGVVLRPAQPFRLAFETVRVPWDAIEGVTHRAYMLFDVTELRYGDRERALIGFLPSAAASAISERISGRLASKAEPPAHANS